MAATARVIWLCACVRYWLDRVFECVTCFYCCNIFEAWLLSLPPLPSRQVNMADSCELIFHLFGRHHCKSRIFLRMENFQNDCCRPWTKQPFKKSCSRQLRIVNAVAIWWPAGQIDCSRYVLQVAGWNLIITGKMLALKTNVEVVEFPWLLHDAVYDRSVRLLPP